MMVDLDKVRERKPFQTAWVAGYLTKGGSYVIASRQADRQPLRDLIMVFPAVLNGRVAVAIDITANPEWVDALDAALKA